MHHFSGSSCLVQCADGWDGMMEAGNHAPKVQDRQDGDVFDVVAILGKKKAIESRPLEVLPLPCLYTLTFYVFFPSYRFFLGGLGTTGRTHCDNCLIGIAVANGH